MPDMQTALAKVLGEWEKEEKDRQLSPKERKEKTMFKPTNNVSRTTFDFIARNPGLTLVQIGQALGAQGYKANSVTSLTGQMRRLGSVRRDESGRHYATAAEFVPIKPSKLKAARLADAAARKAAKDRAKAKAAPDPALKLAKVQSKIAEGIEGTMVNNHPVYAPVNLKRMSTADMLETLSIAQARDLYDNLKKIFGG